MPEESIITLKQVKMNGLEFNIPAAENERSTILRILAVVNRNVEYTGQEHVIELQLAEGKKRMSVSLLVDRIMEIDELLNKHTLGRSLHPWLDIINAGTRQVERPRPEGMSWVHMAIREDETLLGWLTACLCPVPNRRKYLRISFAFCMPRDCFSKRYGRITSRERMDADKYYVVNGGDSDRYSVVENLIHGILSGEDIASVIEDKWGDTFPSWLSINRKKRNDIPKDALDVLEHIYGDLDADPLVRRMAAKVLRRDIEFKGEPRKVRDS